MDNRSKEKKGNSLAGFLLEQLKHNYQEALEADDPIVGIYCLGVGDGYADAYLTITGEDAKKVFPEYEKITDMVIERL